MAIDDFRHSLESTSTLKNVLTFKVDTEKRMAFEFRIESAIADPLAGGIQKPEVRYAFEPDVRDSKAGIELKLREKYGYDIYLDVPSNPTRTRH